MPDSKILNYVFASVALSFFALGVTLTNLAWIWFSHH